MKIQVNTANMSILECFASETRVKIIELLNDKPMNIKEIADVLKISSAIVTKHIQKLETSGFIHTESISGTRGRRKVCHLLQDTVTLQLKTPAVPEKNQYAVSIPVGQYVKYDIQPTCGLASETSMIGMVDDPRYFSDPDHVKAKHIWFGSGYLAYRIPNYLVGKQVARQVSISLEVCSEAPGYNENWPSDLSFFVNDILVGVWTCPGDFGVNPGVHTPAWWNLGTQHGLLKTISVNKEGAFIDGIRFSNVTVKELNISTGQDIHFRIACLATAEHCGGVSLFGKQFGNYNQDIEVSVYYENE
jgi:predicted transcriptional regulator